MMAATASVRSGGGAAAVRGTAHYCAVAAAATVARSGSGTRTASTAKNLISASLSCSSSSCHVAFSPSPSPSPSPSSSSSSSSSPSSSFVFPRWWKGVRAAASAAAAAGGGGGGSWISRNGGRICMTGGVKQPNLLIGLRRHGGKSHVAMGGRGVMAVKPRLAPPLSLSATCRVSDSGLDARMPCKKLQGLSSSLSSSLSSVSSSSSLSSVSSSSSSLSSVSSSSSSSSSSSWSSAAGRGGGGRWQVGGVGGRWGVGGVGGGWRVGGGGGGWGVGVGGCRSLLSAVPRVMDSAQEEISTASASVHVSGPQVENDDVFFTDMATTWQSLGVTDQLAHALQRAGLDRPSKLQAVAVPQLLKGGDAVVAAETGSGKTHAYVVPLIQRILADRAAKGKSSGSTLLLSANNTPAKASPAPTQLTTSATKTKMTNLSPHGTAHPVAEHALAEDGSKEHTEELRRRRDYRYGFALVLCPNLLLTQQVASMANSLTDANGRPLIATAIIAGGEGFPATPPDLVVATPASLLNHLFAYDPRQRRRTAFIRDLRYMKSPGGVIRDRFPNATRITGNLLHCHNPNLQLRWLKVDSDSRIAALVDAIVRTGNGGGECRSEEGEDGAGGVASGGNQLQSRRKLKAMRIMVFANSVEAVEGIGRVLSRRGVDCSCYHKGVPAQDRTVVLHDFAEKGGVLICTDVASRGLDIPEVAHVVQVRVQRHFIIGGNL
ncbi:hypothetical protein CBR_g3143 [Chara braunii]|uniref:ATP-dependent RNA helicase n=1 Tax=Chara braunii TaxID=69332 RepID=A0A388KEX4_CHABU|nr:hypothetical protein CBR_g3143 [Chara braunii]|eukprot:GBG68600.1 hypothetical protein CBR_g3143 [Chara braunii]